MAMLFISHNLAVVRHLSHRVLVMYLGRLVEVCEGEALFAAPLHPYTRALLAAVPRLPAGAALGGALSPAAIEFAGTASGSGCAFRDRCPFALPLCAGSDPPLAEVAPGRWVACHRSHEKLYPLS